MMSHSQQVQLAVGTQNCFSTQFYTPYTNIKTSAQNAPKCTIARQKITARSPPQPPNPLGRGYLFPRPHPFGAFGASILAPSALGVPVPFHFSTRTLVWQTDSRTDRQTSCHGIVRAMHTRRAVKTMSAVLETEPWNANIFMHHKYVSSHCIINIQFVTCVFRHEISSWKRKHQASGVLMQRVQVCNRGLIATSGTANLSPRCGFWIDSYRNHKAWSLSHCRADTVSSYCQLGS